MYIYHLTFFSYTLFYHLHRSTSYIAPQPPPPHQPLQPPPPTPPSNHLPLHHRHYPISCLHVSGRNESILLFLVQHIKRNKKGEGCILGAKQLLQISLNVRPIPPEMTV